MSFTRVDFPDPETPVTTVINPIGNFGFIFFKLFSRAPKTDMNFPLLSFLSTLSITFFLPDKNSPVMEFLFSMIALFFQMLLFDHRGFQPQVLCLLSSLNFLLCLRHALQLLPYFQNHAICVMF